MQRRQSPISSVSDRRPFGSFYCTALSICRLSGIFLYCIIIILHLCGRSKVSTEAAMMDPDQHMLAVLKFWTMKEPLGKNRLCMNRLVTADLTDVTMPTFRTVLDKTVEKLSCQWLSETTGSGLWEITTAQRAVAYLLVDRLNQARQRKDCLSFPPLGRKN